MPRLPTRLIPAHAGKTLTRDECLHISSGSSPLTRGKRSRGEKAGGGGGLIPAHAGKTRLQRLRGCQAAAHPRSRGENYATRRDLSRPSGSSPLTRGKPDFLLQYQRKVRLIPAHAGKTPARHKEGVSIAAHPRSRGENQDDSAPVDNVPWLIPAHAGKTRTTAHLSTMFPGSSPLTRGNPPFG